MPQAYIGVRYIVSRYNEGVVPDADPRLELGRFAEPAVLVLVSLSSGPKHGYAIMADIERFAADGIGPGTLYAVLARLEQAGMVAPLPSDDRRRPYRLTPTGSAALASRLAEMGRLVRRGRARLRSADRSPA